MTVIYQTTITHIGACATMALEEQMLITFREGAPADIEEYCFIHNHGELAGTLQPGAELQLGEQRYPVTAVGEVAEQLAVLDEGGGIVAIVGGDGHQLVLQNLGISPCGRVRGASVLATTSGMEMPSASSTSRSPSGVTSQMARSV